MTFYTNIDFYNLDLNPGDFIVDDLNERFQVLEDGSIQNFRTKEIDPKINLFKYWEGKIN